MSPSPASGCGRTATSDNSELPQLAHKETLADQARDYIRRAKAPSTIRAYRSDWTDFSAWCDASGVTSMPSTSETICLYLTDRAGAAAGDPEHPRPASKISTLQRRLSSISKAH